MSKLVPDFSFRNYAGFLRRRREPFTEDGGPLRRRRRRERSKIRLQLLLPFDQLLQTELPTMKLDAVLVDVAGDLGALRLVFLQLVLKICAANRINQRDFRRYLRDGGRLTAPLAIQCEPRRGRTDDKRGRAMLAFKNN